MKDLFFKQPQILAQNNMFPVMTKNNGCEIYKLLAINIIIVLAIENVSNFQMHNEPRLFQRIF